MIHLCRSLFAILMATSIFAASCPADDAAEAQKIVDRAVKAIGGKAVVEKARISILDDSGTYYGMGNGLPYTGRYVSQFGEPSRFRMEIKGVFVQVVNGDKAWVSAGGQIMDVEGEALETLKAGMLIAYAASLIPLQKPNDKFRLSLAEPETVEGEECDGIKVDHEGMPTVTLHFSRRTGLVRKMKHKTKAAETGFQEVVDESVFHEYRKFDGVPSVVKMTIMRDGKKFLESAPTNYSYPTTVDDSEFEKP